MIIIKKLKKITEHNIKDELLKNKNLDMFLQQANYYCDFEENIIKLTKIQNYFIYLLVDKEDEILSYMIIQNNNGFKWLMEIMSIVKNKGYAQNLLIYIIKNISKPLFLDVSLTEDSVKMIEKLIKNKKINVKVADLENEKIFPYDDLDDVHIGMYDKIILGIDREILPSEKAKNLVWVLENISLRREFPMSQYVEFLK